MDGDDGGTAGGSGCVSLRSVEVSWRHEAGVVWRGVAVRTLPGYMGTSPRYSG